MATINPLEFEKDWTNPAQFPAVQEDEAQAREDMQWLFNEIRDYINGTLIPAIPDGSVKTNMNMLGWRITGLGTPVSDSDAATKEYVDSQAESIRTTANIGTSWTGSAVPYTQTINVSGVAADSIVEVALTSTATATQAAAFSALQLQDGGQQSGKITLRCFGTKNTVSIPINIIVRRD